MNIYESLRFTQGAVSKKDFVPALTHFQIKDGRITGYDGKMSLSAPIALDLDCCPKADTFAKAITACVGTAQLHMAANGKLAVRSGKFKAHVECLPPELYPGVTLHGERVEASGSMLDVLQLLYDFSAVDASRPWAAGVLFDGDYAYSTNNVIFAQCWLGAHFPYRVNIPRTTIKELIRIGEEPTEMEVAGNSITFHYEGERWLHSQLVTHPWPEMAGLMGRMAPPKPESAITDEYWEGLATLEPFVDEVGHVYSNEQGLHTATVDGASVELAGLPVGIYNHKMLTLLHGVAHYIDFGAYPDPMTWYGENVRGLFVGMVA
jgi:hypothetical protein